MEEKLLSLVVNVASARQEACEWLSLTSHVEEQKYRQFSADLERRRRRKYNTHLEEKKKVEKELDNLQRDRQRFEREKQLRRRKSWSASIKTKKQSSKSQEKEKKNDYLLHGETLGGSASIAFDPKVEKYSRRLRRKAKTEMFNKTKKDKEQCKHKLEPDESSTNFPYLSEKEVIKFHQSCKSAGLRAECRRWGAAWLYAKKEQDLTPNKDERWNTLLLNAEKEKMRSLCEKWMTLKDKHISNYWIKGKRRPTSSNEKNRDGTEKKCSEVNPKHKVQRENSIIFKEHCENIKASKNGSNADKQTIKAKSTFISPFSKVKTVNAWAIKHDVNPATITKIAVHEERKEETRPKRRANLRVIDEASTSEGISTQSRKLLQSNEQTKTFLPEL